MPMIVVLRIKKLTNYFKRKKARQERAKRVWGQENRRTREQFEYLAKKGLGIPVYTL